MQAKHIANTIVQLLANKSVTFAQLQYTTQVKTAAKWRGVSITKRTNANVQLFANVAADVYANAVKRRAAKIAGNDAANVEGFASSGNYFTHTDCYSIVEHKTTGKQYLYCIYNRASSEYYIDGVAASKQEVAAYLTAGAAAQLLEGSKQVHNVTHDVTHDVTVRTIALENIASITAVGQQVQF